MKGFAQSRRRIAAVILMALSWTPFAGGASAAEAGAQIKVVYHMDDSSRATSAMRSMTNQLEAMPNTKIVVVALADGVEFLLTGAKDPRGNPYEPMIDDLVMQGVEFRACNNTLVARKIERGRLHPDVTIVDSGVAEISRLQATEGFVYVKP
jgi:intracellular sulfur oxidation DsrE/DsrF family protein